MSLLLYCVTSETKDPLPSITVQGVVGAAIQNFTRDPLRCYFSEVDAERLKQNVRQHALEFHSVVKTIFLQTTVVPFRFPSFVPDASELDHLMERKSTYFCQFLDQFEGRVQMDLRISESPATPANPQSGTEYLHSRQQQSRALTDLAESLMRTAGTLSLGWKMQAGQDPTKCSVLIDRDQVHAFRDTMSNVDLAGTPYRVIVSGPWPPMAFSNDKLQD